MKQTLRSRLIKYFSSQPDEVISGGEMERMVSAVTTYKPSTISRRLREIAEDGKLVATYEKGTVFYQWKKTNCDVVVEHYLRPLATQLNATREGTIRAHNLTLKFG